MGKGEITGQIMGEALTKLMVHDEWDILSSACYKPEKDPNNIPDIDLILKEFGPYLEFVESHTISLRLRLMLVKNAFI